MNKSTRFQNYHMIQSGPAIRITKQADDGLILQEVRIPKGILKKLIKEYFQDLN